MKTYEKKEGFVLTAVMMLILIASLVGGAFLISARGSRKTLERWQAYDDCLMGLQSALEVVNYRMYQELLSDIHAHGNRRAALAVLENKGFTTNVVWFNELAAIPHSVTTTVSVSSGSMIESVGENWSEVALVCDATATHRGVTRRVQETVTYNYNYDGEVAGSPPGGGGGMGVFDYVFFIDNMGDFSGVNADFNGNVRANLDILFQYSSIRLNGNAYAGGIVDSKKIYRCMDWDDYGTQGFAGLYFGDKVRPAEHTDFNRSNENSFYEQGYSEEVNFFENLVREDMPFIGPLEDYEEYAIAVGGSVSDSTKTVNAVWGDDAGEDAGVEDTSVDDGCLVLIGTPENPINIDGVIVAQKDIYIKGHFTGQGTLYAGRNIHVMDNMIAVDGPTWAHPDSNPRATAIRNKTKDFLGLCAKGSLIFGEYDNVEPFFKKQPYTHSHATDVTDASLGYVTHYVDGVPHFNGDYMAPDGNGAEQRTDGSLRHFYEPILSDADFDSLGVSTRVGVFDCVLYANHLISGEFDGNTLINGAFVCRDEAVKDLGNLALNWDARLGSSSMDGDSFFGGLPGMMLPALQPLPSRTIQWAEIEP